MPMGLLRTGGCFYKTLYTSQGSTIPPDNEFYQLENDTLLDCNESTSCEGRLS